MFFSAAFSYLSMIAYNGRTVNAYIIKITRSRYGGVEVAIFLQPHKREKLRMWFSWVFWDISQFIYMSHKLNLYTRSEKFQLKSWIKCILVALNPSYTHKGLHNTHTMKHLMNTTFRASVRTMKAPTESSLGGKNGRNLGKGITKR